MKVLAIALLALGTLAAAPADKDTQRFLDAIKRVETGAGSGLGVVGDNGKALGPMQIHKVYWIDSRVSGLYEQCGTSREYSDKVVLAYMQRYAPRALAEKNWETLARIHNGGPKGHQKKATVGYWNKVKKEMGKW